MVRRDSHLALAMQDTDETKALVRKFSDRSRKAKRIGSQFIVPHKFSPDGDVLDESNFNAKRDLSRLSLDDFRLLSALQDAKWDFTKACELSGLDKDVALRRYKKLTYFEFEDKKAQALAAVATPAFVTSQNVEGFYRDHLSDGQRDHLKELAKISGAYKNTTNVNVNFNAFVRPELSADEEKKAREFFDTIATETAA